MWTGTHALLLGIGNRHIHRYDPVTDTVERMQATLPQWMTRLTGVWDGEAAYLFGGQADFGGNQDTVLRYDPAADQVTTLDARLPQRTGGAAAVWDGTHAYILGGCCYHDTILRFDPRTEALATLEIRLPRDHREGPAVLAGQDIVVFPGKSLVQPWPLPRDVMTYPLRALHPQVAIAPIGEAECDDGMGTVEVDGSASHDPDGDALRFHWRAPSGGVEEPTAAATRASVPYGNHSVGLYVADDAGDWAVGHRNARVVDTIAPEPVLLRPVPDTLYLADAPFALPDVPGADTPPVVVGRLTFQMRASDSCALRYVLLGVAEANAPQPWLRMVASTDWIWAPSLQDGFLAFQWDLPPRKSNTYVAVAAARDIAGNIAADTRTYLHIGTQPCAHPQC